MDDDTLQELEFQLLYGHSYPCALDMHNIVTTWCGTRLYKTPFPMHYDKWLYGKRFMQRSWHLGKRDGATLFAVMLN